MTGCEQPSLCYLRSREADLASERRFTRPAGFAHVVAVAGLLSFLSPFIFHPPTYRPTLPLLRPSGGLCNSKETGHTSMAKAPSDSSTCFHRTSLRIGRLHPSQPLDTFEPVFRTCHGNSCQYTDMATRNPRFVSSGVSKLLECNEARTMPSWSQSQPTLLSARDASFLTALSLATTA